MFDIFKKIVQIAAAHGIAQVIITPNKKVQMTPGKPRQIPTRVVLTEEGISHVLNKLHLCTHYRTHEVRPGFCKVTVTIEDHYGVLKSSGTGIGDTQHAARLAACRVALHPLIKWKE